VCACVCVCGGVCMRVRASVSQLVLYSLLSWRVCVRARVCAYECKSTHMYTCVYVGIPAYNDRVI